MQVSSPWEWLQGVRKPATFSAITSEKHVISSLSSNTVLAVSLDWLAREPGFICLCSTLLKL